MKVQREGREFGEKEDVGHHGSRKEYQKSDGDWEGMEEGIRDGEYVEVGAEDPVRRHARRSSQGGGEVRGRGWRG